MQEYRQLRTVQRARSRGSSDFFQVQPAFVDVPPASKYEARVGPTPTRPLQRPRA